MKKTLLLCAAMLCSLLASADGLVAVGANVILLPSSYYDGDVEWKAWTWVYNTQTSYGDPYTTDNPNYNQVTGVPVSDTEGREWFEPGFDMGPKYDEWGDRDDLNYDIIDEEGKPTPIDWEENTAPFSSDATYNGRTSYRWTTNNIMADIYVRRTFTTDRLLSGPVYLACGHDDAPCEYYINGELVFERTGYETNDAGNIINGWNNGEFVQLTDEQKALIKLNGEENVVAFHVHQNWGGAFADCGLYTKIEGGLDMGYTEPWEGKVLFNSYGGYNWDGASPSNNPRHPWSPLFEAQEGDEYTFTINDAVEDETGMQRIQFKSPIRIEEGHYYNFKMRIKTDKTFNDFAITLADNDNEEDWLVLEDGMTIEAPAEGEEDYEGTLLDFDFEGIDGVNNFMIDLDFSGGEDTTAVSISEISLMDVSPELDDDVELWVGTHYFNFIDVHKVNYKYYVWDDELNDGLGDYREARNDEERQRAIDEENGCYAEPEIVEATAPEIKGRTETLAWTQADFDDSMWDDQMMPVGNQGYMNEVQSIWPGGDNTNYWIRRNFEMESINPLLEYQLNVCHDDVYETYVNGHLLQKNVGWTNGKNPVQVHIPARYLNVGKNVIATYIQQNWGGKFYDCGINVTEINYEECLKAFQDALAYAQTDTLLTNAMKDDVQALIKKFQDFYEENKNDAAELRSYARDSIRPQVNTIFAYSNSVKTLKQTYDICRKLEDTGWWGTSLDDVAAALDTCHTSGELNPYIEALRTARKATAMERHTEKYKGTTPEVVDVEMAGQDMDEDLMPNPRYYIYNVGAKNFLGSGEAWGTHLALEFASNPMMILQGRERLNDEEGNFEDWGEEIEGAYYIESFRPNGSLGEMDFVGWNGFADVNMGNNLWEFIPVEGKENVYNIAQYGQTFANDTIVSEEGDTTVVYGGKKLLGLRSGDNQYAPSYYVVDTDMHTAELETNQWMFISREEMLSFIGTASEDTPADLTFLIQNPGYDQRLSIDDWMFTNGSVFGRNKNYSNFVLESYNEEEFDNVQSLWPEEGEEALPAGTYMLTVQGYYRDGIEETHVKNYLAGKPYAQRALIFAGSDDMEYTNNETIPLMPIHIEANQVPGIGYTYGGLQMPGTYSGQPMAACPQAAQEYFPCGLYQNKLVFTISEDDPGHLSIGVTKPYDEDRLSGDWIVMDNWRLYYYGNGDIDPDAIQEVASDEIQKTNTASKNIYNMLGQRMSKAQKGVNIIGGKKIAIK